VDLPFTSTTTSSDAAGGLSLVHVTVRSSARRRGGRYVVPAWLSLAMLMLLAGASDVAEGRRKLSDLPVAVLAGLFFGSIPALLVGAIVGIVLSKMVTPSAARLPATPSREGPPRGGEGV
jgi:hypothetical protein